MTLDEWADRLGRGLGLDGPAPVERILDLARDAAHGVARPAAPVTTYLVGVAVGRGMSLDEALAVTAGLLPPQDPTTPSG